MPTDMKIYFKRKKETRKKENYQFTSIALNNDNNLLLVYYDPFRQE